MNRLSRADRVAILRCLVEGMSIRATSRITGRSKNTVLKLLVATGQVASEFHDVVARDLTCERLQMDEVWTFVGAKAKNVAKGAKGAGDVWTWTALCADSRLIVSWWVGGRDTYTGIRFVADVASRLSNESPQLTTDGHAAYPEAVERAFGADINYAMLIKEYKADANQRSPSRRYSPGKCIGVRKEVQQGDPDMEHVSTSYVERQNLTMRMSMRRFTRLTNAFSKKVLNHTHAVALHFFHYNFCRVHRTLRVTPAMEAGIAQRVWDLHDLVELLEQAEADADAANPVRPGRKAMASK